MVTAWTYGHFLVSIEMAGALFALVVSVGLLLQSPPKPLFASFLLLLALPQISIAMEFAGVFEAFPILFYAIVPFHVFTGPVGYSALQQISGEKRISVGLMLVAFIIAASASTASFFSGDRISIDLLLVTILLWTVAYVFKMLSLLKLYFRTREKGGSQVSLIIIVHLLFFGFTALSFILNQWLHLKETLIVAVVSLSLIPVFLFLTVMYRPGLLLEARAEIRRGRYERSRLNGLNKEDLLQQLNLIMEEENLYADEDLTLSRLAGLLGIRPHQLSELINQYTGQTFRSFVNRYRVKAAIDLIKTEPERSLLSIAHSVGFNSKSSFNGEFLRHTGLSPKEYRKRPQS